MNKVLIYGGSGAVGGTLARKLHGQGYQLHLAGGNEESLKALALETNATYTPGNILEESFVQKVMSEVGDELGGLVYAIGTINLKSIRRLTKEDFLQDFSLNALGAALAVQGALPALKKGGSGSSVVLISSVAASRGFPMHASISMAKGAVEGLTVALAAELAPTIRVNAIAPSLLENSKLSATILGNEDSREKMASQHPLGRLGQPEDIAAMATFLLSKEAGWISGQIIGVDGGKSNLSR
jgi:NAD(P)-dependent dehydrogenase (short-subunit alcohol dehydrogenase family)